MNLQSQSVLREYLPLKLRDRGQCGALVLKPTTILHNYDRLTLSR